ncbi:MAG: hypothetical protein J5804_03220, partial [Eggerthellaceae bacterium]|nr:hypothetical protein [Eggerthellaceae bacterium]
MNEMLVSERTYDIVTQMLPWSMGIVLGIVVLLVLTIRQSLEISAVKKLVVQLVNEWNEVCVSEGEPQEWVPEYAYPDIQPSASFAPAFESSIPQPSTSTYSADAAADPYGVVPPFVPAATSVVPGAAGAPGVAAANTVSVTPTAAEVPGKPAASTASGPVPPPSFQKQPASPGIPRPWAGKSEEGSLESWVGRNALGVVASILVFLGLVFLGITVAPQLSDQMKVAVLFILSGVLTAGGTALSLYKKNGFTSAVMGCGAGSLFISVFITHLYFNMIGDVAAYALVLAWMGLCLALIRKTDSLLLAIVLQLGLAISVCLGYYGSLDASRIALLLGYQVAASVIVIGGNLLVYRRMYRVSLVLGLVLSIVASCFMWRYFGWGSLHEWALSNSLGLVVIAFTVQLVSAAVLAGLLVVSALGLGERKESIGLLATASGLWFAAIALDLYKVVDRCVQQAMELSLHQATMVASATSLVVMAASILGLLAIGKKRGLIPQNASQNGWIGSPAIMILLCGGALYAAAPA